MKQTVYISGQISGLDKDVYMKRFKDAEERLRLLGFKPVNPTKFWLSKYFYWLLGYDLMFMYDLWRLKKCDGIYMLNGWIMSNGAKIEKLNAEKDGKFVLYERMTPVAMWDVLQHR